MLVGFPCTYLHMIQMLYLDLRPKICLRYARCLVSLVLMRILKSNFQK